MHGREGEERKRGRYMWTGPSRGTSAIVGPGDGSSSSSSTLSSPNSFCKDGRKISVGDCALFKPPQDSPPFIGIIRWLTAGKENKLKLGVNWLYRPAEVKLGKGILLEAAPNEIFYSFHKDEIPAASLLHPCKVAFLPKGVELPSGISSFVCRRVYDITNKCLWWLTDQDYINERQEEVDQLLYKTRIEMHATVQPGGRSPKPMNGPTSTSQLKPGSDSVQNSTSSFPSQGKGKKRERGDQASEPVKRERSTKMDDGDSGYYRPEIILKSEVAKITEKGGLVDSEGVEKLVHLMLPERNEKKIDLVGRSILAGVVAATDKFDCLSRFVQLRGLPVFDEWLQEVHKGKIGDGGGSKDSDKPVEEFLLVLLRALDKLPVNLHALQMCNIGKSVNHLRTHKNLEIQRKARSLVDTWKKRVEAEMDAKSGSNQAVSWPAKPRLPEVSHGGNRHSGGSSEVAVKSSVTQLSASKTASVKLVQGETTTKSASASPGSMKSTPSPASVCTNFKDGQPRNAAASASDLPLTTARDEKSSSSSQSHNNSQSCSSDHARTGGFSGKEDARSSTAGSMTVNKASGGSSRHRKSVNGFPGTALSGAQRESGSSRSSVHRNMASEKLSQSSLTCEKALDVAMVEGNNHKLIVKIPNRGRSPAQSASGGSFDDPSVMNSRASSPVLSEKHDQFDHSLKEKSEAYRANMTSDVNTESWQSNDFKDVLTASDEGDGSPATVPDEERCRAGDDARKLADVSKAACSSSGNEPKTGKLLEASFSSMNALIESCAKYSEANTSMAAGDDVGMNLLASVAAGEMSKSDMVSPTDSPQRNTLVMEHSCTGNDSRVKSLTGNDLVQEQCQLIDGADDEHEEQGTVAGTLLGKNAEGTTAFLSSQEKSGGECDGHLNASSVDLQKSTDSCLEIKGTSKETVIATSLTISSAIPAEKALDGEGSQEYQEKKVGARMNADGAADAKQKLGCSLSVEDVIVSGVKVKTDAAEGSSSYPSLEVDGENKKNMNEDLISSVQKDEKSSHIVMHSEYVKGINEEVLHPSCHGKDTPFEKIDDVKGEKADDRDTGSGVNLSEKPKSEQETNTSSTPENEVIAGLGSTLDEHRSEYEESLERKGINEHINGGSVPPQASPSYPLQETEQCLESRGTKLTGNEADESEECTSATADASSLTAARGSDTDAKVEFDLNEGFSADDGKYGELNNLMMPACSAAVPLITPFPLSVSSASTAVPASITVAAPAKGSFLPPEISLRSKVEPGWKGSAATSAFRPAEPRRFLEMPSAATNMSVPDAAAAKPIRPLLDIDLNVPDERILDDLASRSLVQDIGSVSGTSNRDVARDELVGSAPARSSGGLDLDLNRVDEPTDMVNHLTNNGRRLDAPLLPVKSSTGGFLNGEMSIRRDFDLNDGPVVDEVSAEPSLFSHHARSSVPSQPPVSGIRINNAELGNFSSWFTPGNTYSAVTIPSILPDRGEQPFPMVAAGGPQRMIGPPTSSTPFSPDVYRPVLSSSSAVPFPSTSFQYPVFPFGTSFPLPTGTFSGGSTTYVDSSSGGRLCFPAVHSQLLGPAGAVPSHYPRPYVISLPDGSNNGGAESSRKWARQGLDLNAGPLGPDMEGKDETSLAPRQLSVASSQALAEEQARMYQVAGSSSLKRKEAAGGWDDYKQSWP